MGRRHALAALPAALILALWLSNTALFQRPPDQRPTLVAHRGVHQTFEPLGVGAQDCTATIIRPPTHGFIENTLPAIEAAFAAGADRVEVDLRVTEDGQLVLMHDDTLECRTDGAGKIRDHTLAELKAMNLDLGYGYTHDGETFPLRGEGVGLLRSLPELVAALPKGRFVFDLKDLNEGEARLAATLTGNLPAPWVTGAPRGAEAFGAARPDARIITRPRIKACAKAYFAQGWLGRVPEACATSALFLPANYARLMWGWPHRLVSRMNRAGTDVVVLGDLPYGSTNSRGVDTPEDLDALGDFRGVIWTNRIEVIAPLVRAQAQGRGE